MRDVHRFAYMVEGMLIGDQTIEDQRTRKKQPLIRSNEAAMDYELVLRALDKHVKICQKAVQFFHERSHGVAYAEAVTVLDEAIRARDHVTMQRANARLQKGGFVHS